MILIVRRIDVRPIIGAVVVFSIIGAASFGIYHFTIAKPAAEKLEEARRSVLSQINADLVPIGTQQALSAASSYSAAVRATGSEDEIWSISANVTATVQIERKRKELLDKVESATNGAYFTKADVPELATLSKDLKAEINAKTSRSELEEFEPQLDNRATTAWRNFFSALISNLAENRVVMERKNSSPYGEFMSKENALAYISTQTWETLRKLKFGPSTVHVPILDTFQRAPTITAGSTVKIYVYDVPTGSLTEIFGNAKVNSVICSRADVGVIAWTLTDGAVSYSYSVDMWETIKAAAAGDPEAAAVGWSAYGTDLLRRALEANLAKYDVSIIYVVEVSDTIGELITLYEQYQSATKDIILIQRD